MPLQNSFDSAVNNNTPSTTIQETWYISCKDKLFYLSSQIFLWKNTIKFEENADYVPLFSK